MGISKTDLSFFLVAEGYCSEKFSPEGNRSWEGREGEGRERNINVLFLGIILMYEFET